MKIALAYAMPEEIESLLAAAGARSLETVCGVAFYEIEPDIIAYAGGIGKVNAAMAAQLCLDRYHPDWVVNAGVAGSFHDLPIGTVVLAEDFVQHDVDTSAVDGVVGLIPTLELTSLPTDQPDRAGAILAELGVAHVRGRVATGDVFMVKGDRSDAGAAAVTPTLWEMEGGAIAQVCRRNQVKFTALKSVSDRLCQDNSVDEYFNFAQAMARLNTVVLPFARALRG